MTIKTVPPYTVRRSGTFCDVVTEMMPLFDVRYEVNTLNYCPHPQRPFNAIVINMPAVKNSLFFMTSYLPWRDRICDTSLNSLATSHSPAHHVTGGRLHGHCASLATETF